MMGKLDDPSELSTDQRLHEIAEIFAAGVLRLRKHRLLAGEPDNGPEGPTSKTVTRGLEVSDETVLSVQSG